MRHYLAHPTAHAHNCEMEQALEKEEEARRLRIGYVEQLQQQTTRELQYQLLSRGVSAGSTSRRGPGRSAGGEGAPAAVAG